MVSHEVHENCWQLIALHVLKVSIATHYSVNNSKLKMVQLNPLIDQINLPVARKLERFARNSDAVLFGQTLHVIW